MFEIRKPDKQRIIVIRAATGSELTEYEKSKLANIEDGAQKNIIESISLNGVTQPINAVNKEVNITLGSLAFKETVTPTDLSSDHFLIECDLDDII